MAYTGPDDPNLPEHVKALAADQRAEWVSAFNATPTEIEADARTLAEAGGSVMVPQDEAEYDLFAGTAERSCATCRWFQDRGDYFACRIVAGWPNPIMPTATSNRFEAIPQVEPTPLPVEVVSMPSSRSVAGWRRPFAALVEKVRELTDERAVRTISVAKNLPVSSLEAGFRSLKAEDGSWWWLGITSNNLQDGHATWFGAEAHREYVSARDAGADAGDVWMWHTPGTAFAEAEGVDYVETDGVGFLVEWGPFKRGFDDVAERFSEGGWAMSHTFVGIPTPDEPEVFSKYRILERGPLPREAASNPWTGFAVSKREEQGDMKIDAAKRPELVELFGEDRIAEIEANFENHGDAVRALGLDTRSEPEPAPKPDPTPAAKPADTADPEKATDPPAPQVEPAARAADKSGGDIVAGLREVMAEGIDGLAAELAPVLKDHGDAIRDIQVAVRELKQTDDEKVAAVIKPRAGSRFSEALVASTAESSKVDKRTSEYRDLGADTPDGVPDGDAEALGNHPLVKALGQVVGSVNGRPQGS